MSCLILEMHLQHTKSLGAILPFLASRGVHEGHSRMKGGSAPEILEEMHHHLPQRPIPCGCPSACC